MSDLASKKERVFEGISANSGIAIGHILCIDNRKRKVVPKSIEEKDINVHLESFSSAKNKLVEELSELLEHLNSDSSAIIETQKQIILDAEIERKVSEIIKEELLSSEFAVYRTFCDYIERLKESGSELFQQRIVDLENLRDRFLELICDDPESDQIKKDTIIVTKEISPVELVALHEQGAIGLVMEKSGVTSHASLIAQSLGIPCIVNAKNTTSYSEQSEAVLDGREGQLIVNPANKTLSRYKKLLKKIEKKESLLLKNLSEPSKTKSGTEFKLSANVEFESELELLKKYNTDSIGLLRTEGLLFSGKTSFEDQSTFYESVLASVSEEVTFRLFDVGGDKLSSRIPEEANPFLGWRGIRMLLDERDLLDVQLKALLMCAGQHPGKVKILVPMISVQEEVLKLKDIIAGVHEEIKKEGSPVDENIQIGAMIEVPSAALNAEKLAKELDFLSIGTNDLTQYTLAVDRGNEKICSLYQQQHPSVWKLIKITADAAKKTKTEIAVCGELAGNPLGACGLLGLGVSKLSMISGSIPKVKEELISHTDGEFQALAQSFLNATTSSQVKELFEDWRKH